MDLEWGGVVRKQKKYLCLLLLLPSLNFRFPLLIKKKLMLIIRNPEYFNVPEDIPLEEAVSNAWEVHGTVLHVGGDSNFYSTVSMNATK